MAGYGNVVLTAFREVENGLTNENLLAQRLRFEKKALSDRTEAVRISKVQYDAGEIDMLSVLQLQEYQTATHGNVISLSNAQLANRINLHLAIGGSFDAAAATATASTW